MIPKPAINGVIVIDKPSGPTSHGVVLRARQALGRKTGHLGTLDPAATGVLPLVLGRATRLARFFRHLDKEYLARIRLGKETDTYDGTGRVVGERSIPRISEIMAQEILSQFRGRIRQLPPMFSAVRVDGERLYRAARRREERRRPERSVSIHQLVLLSQEQDLWNLRICCSSGTYIRSLAHDIGKVIGSGAYLEQLRRTRAGDFDLTRALQPDQIAPQWEDAIIPLEELLLEFAGVDLKGDEAKMIRHGNPIPSRANPEGQFTRLIFQDQLVAIGKVKEEMILPQVVLWPAE